MAMIPICMDCGRCGHDWMSLGNERNVFEAQYPARIFPGSTALTEVCQRFDDDLAVTAA